MGVVPTAAGGRRDLEANTNTYFETFYIPFDTANFIFGSVVLGVTFFGWFIIFFGYIDSFPDLQLDEPINDEPSEDQLDDFSKKEQMQ